MQIIDFRLRPPFKSFLNTTMYGNIQRTTASAAKKGMTVAPSARENSVELLLQEMDQSAVQIGVVPGRTHSAFGSMDNEDLYQLTTQYPGRFVALPAIDTTNRRSAIAEIEKYQKKGCRGIVIEPGLLPNPLQIDDRKNYPIYAYCEDNDIFVLLMAGGNAGPDCTYSSPEHIDHVAADFPELKLISGHGSWPWVTQIIHVCYRRPNIYLSPDTYLFNMPGVADYVNAANGFMAERFLFASAYPFVSLDSAVEKFLHLGFTEENLERILFRNAARLLGL